MTEKVSPFFTMSTSDVPAGATISGVEVEIDTLGHSEYPERFNSVRLVKEQKPIRRGILMPGSATVTLGSEKANGTSDSHN